MRKRLLQTRQYTGFAVQPMDVDMHGRLRTNRMSPVFLWMLRNLPYGFVLLSWVLYILTVNYAHEYGVI